MVASGGGAREDGTRIGMKYSLFTVFAHTF